jgi:alkylhydroperoxidase family enzyme
MSDAPAALHEIVNRSHAGLNPELEERVASAAATHEIDPRILASLDHSPRRLELYLDYYDELVTGPLGSDRLKSVIRRRVADLTELRERGELGQDASPEPPAGLSADERALVRFMDAWAIDHQNVDPAIYDELRKHFTDAALTELLWAVAIVFASARVGATVGVTAFTKPV